VYIVDHNQQGIMEMCQLNKGTRSDS